MSHPADLLHRRHTHGDAGIGVEGLVGGGAIDAVSLVGSRHGVVAPELVAVIPLDSEGIPHGHLHVREIRGQLQGVLHHLVGTVEIEAVLTIDISIVRVDVIDAAYPLVLLVSLQTVPYIP